VQELADSRARLDIRWVGGFQMFLPRVRVWIDCQCEGGLNLTDLRVQPFLVTPGLHSVHVECALWRSETWDVTLAAGEKATFQSGFCRDATARSGLYVATCLGGTLFNTLGLPLTGYVATGLGGVALLFSVWRDSKTPGSWLFLRPKAERPLLEIPTPHITQRLRMTIRRWMVLVALIALLLASGVQERLTQRRAAIERRREVEVATRRERFRYIAQTHADTETFWRKSVARRAALEESIINHIETLLNMSRSGPERVAADTELLYQKQRLELVRNLRAEDAQRAASAAQLKEKYLDAAKPAAAKP
jgi:hypothetical protein